MKSAGDWATWIVALLPPVLSSCGGPSARPAFDYRGSIGVALHRDAASCLEIPASLSIGQRFLFIAGVKPAESGEAVVIRKLDKRCAFAEHNQNGPAFESYEFKVLNGSLPNAAPAFAVINPAGQLKGGEGGYSADLDGDGRREVFRACTSNEGVHLTIWSGEPTAGQRKWHYCHYLAYDVEPACTAAEMQPDAE